MTQEHINIQQTIEIIEADLEYYTIKFDNAEHGSQDRFYYMGIMKGLEITLSTIKSQLP